MLLFLYLFLLLLLISYISLYRCFIYAYRTNKITTRPEMIPPVRLLFQLRITPKQLDSQLALQNTHQSRNRYLRGYRQNNMYMIKLYAQLLNIAPFPLAQHTNIFLNKFLDLTSQYSESILRNPDNVIITLIYNMRQFPVFAHVTNIGIADRTLPPSKTVDF